MLANRSVYCAPSRVNRIECVQAFARVRQQAIVIVSPGFTGHELAAAEHDDATLYNMEMGYAAPMCAGLALARPAERVVAFEGDGSMLMGLSTFGTIGRYAPRNLTVVVFDNGCYLTTGSGAVATATAHGVDLAAVARAVGIAGAIAVRDLPAFEAAIATALTTDGPWVIVAHVDNTDRADPRARGGFPHDLVEQSVLFGIALQRRRQNATTSAT
jgi:thiamine pyrophosphate-dependent acetolactate synthase large subunit-like protein